MTMQKRHDVIIVGLGPAAATAAIYCFRKKLDTLLIGKMFGGALLNTGEIENWPGIASTTGFELAEMFEKHVRSYCPGGECIANTFVTEIKYDGGGFVAICEDGSEYAAKTVIYAAGRTPRYLGVPGEDIYRGKGVTYCATCDGPLYRGKSVAVVGGGNSAMEAALSLLKYVAELTLITKNPEMAGDAIYIEEIEKAAASGKLKLITSAVTSEIIGDGRFVTGLKAKIGAEGKELEVPCRGIFVEIGSLPFTGPVKAMGVELNKYGEIVTDRDSTTSVPGFYAAGDATDVTHKQIVIATGMACSAALSAAEYLLRGGK